jgi:hypothetical protein
MTKGTIDRVGVEKLAAGVPLQRIGDEDDLKGAIWHIEPISYPVIDRRLYRFIAELQIGIHISLMRDIMGPRFCRRKYLSLIRKPRISA